MCAFHDGPVAESHAVNRPRLFKWLHGIGYVCTALVLAELAAFLYFAIPATIEHRRYIARQMEETRTREGALTGGDEIHADALALLKPLPPLNSLGANGLRFVAMPQLSRFHYALSLAGSGGDAEGILIVTDRGRDGPTSTIQHFAMPRAAYAALMADFDGRADGFTGIDTDGACLDGTEIAFERIRGSRVTSGLGNGACFAHYRALGDLVKAALLQAITPSGPPVGENWYPHATDSELAR